MDIAEITKMIEAVKQIIEKNDYIDLPLFQNSSQLRLKGNLSLIHISEPTRREWLSRMPSSA